VNREFAIEVIKLGSDVQKMLKTYENEHADLIKKVKMDECRYGEPYIKVAIKYERESFQFVKGEFKEYEERVKKALK
jgi:hypothetical protein